MKDERLQQLENILGVACQCEQRDITGRITYDFPAGIVYENLQLLLTCISKGLNYQIYFFESTLQVVPDGILITPRTIVVNGRQIVSHPISVSWIDFEYAQQKYLEGIQDFFKDKYV